MTTRWMLTIEYDGSDYAGWQRQNDQPTIQQAVEEAITGFSGQNATLHAAGRTDAGVHAYGQIAHVDLEEFSRPMNGHEVAKAINAYLRKQRIKVVEARETEPDFHARFSAKEKLYRYRILNRAAPPALDAGRIWHIKRPLDADAMQEAANHLIGHHDFTTFRDSQCQAKTPMRTLDALTVKRGSGTYGDDEIAIEARAQSFLHHQVRNIAGTLALVGEGKWQPDDMKTALEARDRTKGGPTAPAQGLYLVRIWYDT